MKNKGFTLIETLVALLVVAVAYTGVATAMSQFVDQRLLLVKRNASHRIAWNRLMEQYLVSRQIDVDEPSFAEKNGTLERKAEQWRWQILEEEAAGEDLVRYQVDVFLISPSGADNGKNPEGSLVAYFTR